MTTTTLTNTPKTANPFITRQSASKYATEAIGTMFLVFTVGAAVGGAGPLAPFAIGAILMAMIYAGGHISGAHYNPAVTLAMLVRRRIDIRDALGYWIGQAAGALAGAAVVAIVLPVHAAPLSRSGHTMLAAIIAELLFTFALCYVVLNVATSKDHPKNSFYGIAIGLVVVAGAVTAGHISGGALNPAVVFGGTAIGSIALSMLLPYVVVQLVAGVLAGIVFRSINPDDK
jgi:aquaporin Z